MKLYLSGCPVREIEASTIGKHPAEDGSIDYCVNPILDLWKRAYLTKVDAARNWAVMKREDWKRAEVARHDAERQYNELATARYG